MNMPVAFYIALNYNAAVILRGHTEAVTYIFPELEYQQFFVFG